MARKRMVKGSDLSAFEWDQAKNVAAFLIATDAMTEEFICQTLGIHVNTLLIWKSYNEFQVRVQEYSNRLVFKLEKHLVKVLSKNLYKAQTILDRKLANEDVQRSMDPIQLMREVRMHIETLARIKTMNLPDSEEGGMDDYKGASLVEELLGQLPEEKRELLRTKLIDKAREIVDNKRVQIAKELEY